MSNPQSPILSIIGGTGAQGTALATRFAKAGVTVIIGSRDAKRGANKAQELNTRLGLSIRGMSNKDAAAQGDLVLLSVPYDGMLPILEEVSEVVAGKIVINIASSLNPEKRTRAQIMPKGSITAEIQEFFGEKTRVVAALQNISPEKLESPDEKIDSDVLVCGADKNAREQVIGLIRTAGIDAFDAGLLPNAVALETLTAVLIWINVKYKIKGTGIRLTGVPRE